MSVFNLYIIWDRSYVNPLYFLNQRWIIKIIMNRIEPMFVMTSDVIVMLYFCFFHIEAFRMKTTEMVMFLLLLLVVVLIAIVIEFSWGLNRLDLLPYW